MKCKCSILLFSAYTLELLPLLLLICLSYCYSAPVGGYCNEPNECICRDGYGGDLQLCEIGESRLTQSEANRNTSL